MVMRTARLTALLVAAAATVVACGLLIGLEVFRLPALAPFAIDTEFAAEAPLPILLAIGVIALAQLTPLRVRAGGGNVRMAWGEAAIVVACALIPATLVPAAVLIGVASSHLALSLTGQRRKAVDLIFGIAALTVAGGAATVAVTAINPSYDVRLEARVVVALCVGALVYSMVAALLVAMRVVAEHGGRVLRTFVDMVSSKLLMVVGNIAVGLFIVWSLYTDVWFLVLLPPLFWLLHQFYGHRLSGDDDRRTWREFAEASRDLNRLDERAAVEAGLAGALRLFRATGAQIVIEGTGGHARAYESDQAGEVRIVPVRPAGDEVCRALLVRQVRIGELRLSGVRPMSAREGMMLAAYGDALAGAVHDAVTHDELRTMSERTTYDAIHDPLTGLANRAALLTRGNSALHRLDGSAPVALLLLDVNHFKEVNNALGHTAGDELLQVIARRVTDSSSAGDLIARLGGDEFALLVTDLPAGDATTADPSLDPAAAAAVRHGAALASAIDRARRLAEQVAVPTEVAGVVLSVEASIGVVVAPAGGVDMTELLRRADIAMYQAKGGGQPVAWYDAVRDEASTDRLALLAELREALTVGDQLTLVLQPAVSLASPRSVSASTQAAAAGGEVTGVEALLRWQHPRRGRLMPEQFLSTVEQSELIGPLTLRVLDRALAIAARWHAAGLAVPISVNLSARTLLDRRLPGQIDVLLARHRVPAELLVLEITESVVLSDLPVIDDVLAGIRALGVQLAVDGMVDSNR
jgi:predicted signal transduction protein with EAL and GGDEF domain